MTIKAITLAVTAAVFIFAIASVRAEQQEPKRVGTTLPPPPKLLIRADELFPLRPPTRLGIFTLAPPEKAGEVIRVSIPVGELISRTVRAVSDANHRRAERKADERVRKDLERFLSR